MNCPDCSTLMVAKQVPEYDLGGMFGLSSVTLLNAPAEVCPSCGHVLVPGTIVDEAHEALVAELLGARHVLGPEEFRFLRKAALLSQSALADRLGVNRVEVSRWETEKVGISAPVSLAIRAVVANVVYGNEMAKVERIRTAFSAEPMLNTPTGHEISRGAGVRGMVATPASVRHHHLQAH